MAELCDGNAGRRIARVVVSVVEGGLMAELCGGRAGRRGVRVVVSVVEGWLDG
jgi:hypothetical protein